MPGPSPNTSGRGQSGPNQFTTQVKVEFVADTAKLKQGAVDVAKELEKLDGGLTGRRSLAPQTYPSQFGAFTNAAGANSPAVLSQMDAMMRQTMMGIDMGGGPRGGGSFLASGSAGGVTQAAAALTTVAQITATIAKLGNTSMDSRRQIEALANSVPIVGGMIAGGFGALNDVYDQLQHGGIMRKIGDRENNRFSEDAFRTSFAGAARLNRQMSMSEAEAKFMTDSQRQYVQQSVSRQAFGGGLFIAAEASKNPRGMEARKYVEDAERASSESRGLADMAGKEYLQSRGNVSSELDKLRGISNAITGAMRGNRDDAKPKVAGALVDYERLQPTLGDSMMRNQIALENLKRRELDAAQKILEFDKARTNEMRTQISLLEGKREAAFSREASYGAMQPHEQAQFLEAANLMKKIGFEKLTPDMKQIVLSNDVTSEAARIESAASARKDPRFQDVLSLYNKKDSETYQKEILAKQELLVKVEFDAVKYREMLEKIIRDINEELRDQNKNEALIRKIEAQIKDAQRFTGAGQ